MDAEVFEILQPGLAATLQDHGRSGWRRFGVPPSGAMDRHAADWANRLLDNCLEVPVLELLLQGAKFKALLNVWIAITGAEMETNVPTWRAVRLRAGDMVEFTRNRSGVWGYLAVEGGFVGPRYLG